MTTNKISFEGFTRFRQKYFEQIEKLERKIQYFLFRSQNFIKEDSFLEDMFLESILVDVRALLMENERYKKNYTMQNSFRIYSSDDENDFFSKIASEIDQYVKVTMLPDGQTNFYESVKFYTDKYIAHRDSTTPDDDEKRAELKSYFLDDQNFSLALTVQALIEITEEFKEELQCRALEALTKVPNEVEFESPIFVESNDPLDEECGSVHNGLETRLIQEVLKKSPKDIAYLIGLDVRGIQASDIEPEKLKQMILEYIRNLSGTRKREFMIKVNIIAECKPEAMAWVWT